MPEYATSAGFRAAVEARLRQRAHRLGIAAYAIRRQAALERLMARLTNVARGRWALKGGLALDTRLGERARVSLDLDADHIHGVGEARSDLQRALVEDIGDSFDFALLGSEALTESGHRFAMRFRLESALAGRTFEPLQVDVTLAAPERWDAQPACRPGLLAELGFAPIEVLLVPLERHVAEKVHASTRTYKGAGTTRSRDIVDLLLIRQYEGVDPAALQRAIMAVFAGRGTHAVPGRLPVPPRELAVSYRREAERVGLVRSLNEAHELLATWLDPVLAAIGHGSPAGPDTGVRRVS